MDLISPVLFLFFINEVHYRTKNNCKINFFVSDLFQKVTEKYDLIIFSAPLGDYSSSFMSKYLEIVKSVFPKDSKMLHKAAFELTKNQRAKLIQRFLIECQNYVNKNSMVLMALVLFHLIIQIQLSLPEKALHSL